MNYLFGDKLYLIELGVYRTQIQFTLNIWGGGIFLLVNKLTIALEPSASVMAVI